MKRLFATALTSLALAATGSAWAQQGDMVVMPMQYGGVSESLYSISLNSAPAGSSGMVTPTEMLQKHGPLIQEYEPNASLSSGPTLVTPAFTQVSTTATPGLLAGVNFEGPGTGMPGFVLTGAPPDTTMAVGPNHVIAWVNSMYAVMSKTGTVLALLNGNAPFAGLGGLCETTNRGDPLVQYDRLADRWVMSQFAFGAGLSAPYLQCIAVSTSNNPLGTYHRYVIDFTASGLNDYGKLGIFHDGYYMSYNMFPPPSFANTGAILCASDRVKMLAGDPTASTLCTPVGFYGGGASFLPADVDGTTAPTTTAQGNIFMRVSTTLNLRMIKLKPNFAAGTGTFDNGFGGPFGSFVNVPIGPTTNACNGTGGTCIAQPGTANTLDTLGSRLMYRLAYRNRGGVDSLMVTHSVDPDGAGARSATVRWYEIRSPFAAAPTLFQNANYDPGASGDRWMGSIAMDKMGNMLIGYSYANAAAGVKPSIRVAGRMRSDVRNRMRGEETMMAGTGSQTGTLNRWGDYTTMQVDPVDDCTFWYIGQYLAADGTFNWRTRVGSYKFAGCS